MKRMIRASFLSLLLILALGACGQKVSTWQEQYDLGMRYLEEGNYAEAIIAFTAAIEIDPKRAEAYIGRGGTYISSGETDENLAAALADYEKAAELDDTNADVYLGLADVYIRMGDYDKALEVLKKGLEKAGNDPSIADKLAEIEKGTILDSSGNVRRKTTYDAEGNITHVYHYSYDSRGYKTGWTMTYYGPDGSEEHSYAEVEFDENGYPSRNVYYDGDGTPSGTYDLMTYNELGQEIERYKYHKDGTFTLFRYFYDEEGRRTRYDVHPNGGEIESYWIYSYDEKGNSTGQTCYNADGTIRSTSVYS